MVGKRELVKQGEAFDAVAVCEDFQITAQCIGIAGNIEDVVEAGQ